MATIHYGTVSGFIAYFEERNMLPNISDNAIRGALVVASEWIDAVYRKAFPGLKTGEREQEREWPRTGAMDWYGYKLPTDSVPPEIIAATYEAALRENETPGSLSIDYTPPKYRHVAVTGAVAVTYATFDDIRDVQIKFARVDQAIAPVLIADQMSNLTGSVLRI